jgi:hypothetical protein
MRPRQTADMRGLNAVGILLQLHVFSGSCGLASRGCRDRRGNT